MIYCVQSYDLSKKQQQLSTNQSRLFEGKLCFRLIVVRALGPFG